MSDYNTIKIKKYVDIVEEYAAAAAITPGQVLELTTADKVQAHSSASQNVLPMIALEDELQGNGINDAYSTDDKVQVWVPVRGEIAYLILADGEDVDEGNFVESNGAGYVQKHTEDIAEGGSSAEAVTDQTIYTNQIIGQSLEDVNLSSSSGAESSGVGGDFGAIGYARRIKVRIL